MFDLVKLNKVGASIVAKLVQIKEGIFMLRRKGFGK